MVDFSFLLGDFGKALTGSKMISVNTFSVNVVYKKRIGVIGPVITADEEIRATAAVAPCE